MKNLFKNFWRDIRNFLKYDIYHKYCVHYRVQKMLQKDHPFSCDIPVMLCRCGKHISKDKIY